MLRRILSHGPRLLTFLTRRPHDRPLGALPFDLVDKVLHTKLPAQSPWQRLERHRTLSGTHPSFREKHKITDRPHASEFNLLKIRCQRAVELVEDVFSKEKIPTYAPFELVDLLKSCSPMLGYIGPNFTVSNIYT
jgi:hypothetical protein